MRVSGQHHARPLYPLQRPGTYCTGRYVGPRAVLDGSRKSRLPSGFNPRTFHPVGNLYTDWAILPTLARALNEKGVEQLGRKTRSACVRRNFMLCIPQRLNSVSKMGWKLQHKWWKQLIHSFIRKYRRPESVSSIGSRLRTGRPRNRSSIPSKHKTFFLHRIDTGSKTQQAKFQWESGGSLC